MLNSQTAQPPPASAAEILDLVGEIEPLTLDKLLATRATISEIAAAVDAIEDEDGFGTMSHAPLSPREAEVRAILEAFVFENADEREDEYEIERT